MKPPKEATHTLQRVEDGPIFHFLNIKKPNYYYMADAGRGWTRAYSNIFTFCKEKPSVWVLKPIRKIQLENK